MSAAKNNAHYKALQQRQLQLYIIVMHLSCNFVSMYTICCHVYMRIPHTLPQR